ncbi:MAG: NAD(P)H-hydrate dehydratase [Solirubrobacterales bacterium]|nr:NAD(P)H-hydrate dehydratase [Solirubrobacterales bacterium]
MEDWLEPCLDAEQMRAVDRWAIEVRGVPSLELMETAGAAVAEAASEIAGDGPVRVVCGKGNNGGDGLVAARRLAELGFDAEALLLAPEGEMSGDAAANLERVSAARHVEVGELDRALGGSSVVIDAVFGTGFAGEPRDPAATAVEAINDCPAQTIAVDIPSGVNASSGEVEGVAVDADITVSFHARKIGHFVAPGKWHSGELRVVEIGIPEGAPVVAGAGLIDPSVLARAPKRDASSTKFSSGQVVVIGASRGLTGAVCMCSRAAIRSGAGYATAAVPVDVQAIVATKLTEVMTLGCATREGKLRPAASEQIIGACEQAAAVVLGPGMGGEAGTQRLARELAERIKAPLVIDADGLNAHANRLDALAERRAPKILTPHEGELARLLDVENGWISAHRLDCAREAAAKSGAVVVLKGDDTIVTDGERVAINRIDSPALATAGTGDVLSGMIAAMVARGLDPFTGACAAVVAHARAGRAAAERFGAESVIAGDVIESIHSGLAL